MTTGSISFSFLTKKVPIKKRVDTRLNILDQVEFLKYNSFVTDSSVGISMLSGDKVDVKNNLLIKNLSSLIPGNDAGDIDVDVLYSRKYISNYSVFHISDIVNRNDEPLFFWHNLSEEEEVNNLTIENHRGELLSSDFWIFIDESEKQEKPRKGIYTNLECSYDEKTKETTFYFLKYRNKSGTIISKLLDAKPFYVPATFAGSSKDRTYSIQKRKDSKFDINISFDGAEYSPTPSDLGQRFFIKTIDKATISVLPPLSSGPDEKWKARIRPGDMFLGGQRYSVPEFHQQIFNPYYPYKIVREKELERITNSIFRTDFVPIVNLPSGGFFIHLCVKNHKNEITMAFSTDNVAEVYTTKNGFITDIFYEKDVIKSVSTKNGYIELTKEIDEDSKVYATFYYIEDYLPYIGLNLNPGLNPEILGKKVLFYCIPNQPIRSIHHLLTDNSGRILEGSEQDKYQSKESVATGGSKTSIIDSSLDIVNFYTGYELEFLSGGNSGKRAVIETYDIEEKSLGLATEMEHVVRPGDRYRINKKLNKYISQTTSGAKDFPGILDEMKQENILIIGEINIVQTLSISDIESFDVRIPGGGIKEEKMDIVQKLQPESKWYWDIGNFDGDAFPGMGAVLVKLPRGILKELGGSFSRPQVEEIVLKHMGEGIYPLIRYYDLSTEINAIIPGDKSVAVSWRVIDVTKYNIYIGNSPDNLFLYEEQPGTRGHTTIEGLENNKTYYIQIEPVSGGYERLRSRVVAFMPFNFSEVKPPTLYGKGNYGEATYE